MVLLHNLKEGQQIRFSSINATIGGVAMTTSDVFTVRNPATNSFELFLEDGITSTNVDAFVAAGNVTHGVVVLSSVNGEFSSVKLLEVCIRIRRNNSK